MANIEKRKRKRINFKCLSCGSIRRLLPQKYEIRMHNDERVRIKHIGAAGNPFEYAKTNFEIKVIEYDKNI